MTTGVRRVVTGTDADGKSAIVSDTIAPGVETPGRIAFELWATSASSSGGTTIRIVEMPAGAQREMHRSDTVDYCVVLQGELFLILERAETLLQAGDVVVQQGTFHGWANRSPEAARIAFINMTGQTSLDPYAPQAAASSAAS